MNTRRSDGRSPNEFKVMDCRFADKRPWLQWKHSIVTEVAVSGSDIITFQDVQKDIFMEWLQPQLRELGYEGVFKQYKQEATFANGRYTVLGLATFCWSSRFRIVDQFVIDHDLASDNEQRYSRQLTGGELRDLDAYCDEGDSWILGDDPEEKAWNQGAISLVVFIEDMSATVSADYMSVIAVFNTFLSASDWETICLCQATSENVLLWHAHLLSKLLSELQTHRPGLPILICGDLSSIPDSPLHRFLATGQIDGTVDIQPLMQHFFKPGGGFSKRDPGRLRSKLFEARSPLQEAFGVCALGETLLTYCGTDTQRTVDYIWFSPESLDVLAVIALVPPGTPPGQQVVLPSPSIPSDHVPLIAIFVCTGTGHAGLIARDDPPLSQLLARHRFQIKPSRFALCF